MPNLIEGARQHPKALLGIVGGCLGVILLIFLYQVFNPISFHSSAFHVELGEPWDPMACIRSIYGAKPEDIQIEGTVDSTTPGTYEVTYTLKNSTEKVTFVVSDTKAPELVTKDVLTGLTTEVDPESFVQSVEDFSKVSLDILNPEALDPSLEESTVVIQAIDEYGNSTSKKANLKRVFDDTAPEILTAVSSRTVPVGDSFEPLALEVKDDIDPSPSIEVNSQNLNTAVPGVYEVTYIVSDFSGNTTKAVETIHVE